MTNNKYKHKIKHRYRIQKGKKLRAITTLAAAFVFAVVLIVLLLTAIVGIFGGGDENGSTTENSAPTVAESTKREYKLPPASEKNDLVEIVRTKNGSGKKVCYLTFDDGPTKDNTAKILDILKKYNVKATFFCLGKMIEANPDVAKREYDEGHLVTNHTYYHEYGDLYASGESFMKEVNMTQEKIKEVTGEEPFKLMRFPGGSYNAGSYAAEKQEYKKLLKENGFYYADWNCLNGDAESALKSTEELINGVKKTALEDNLIVLMHDASAKTTTPEALGPIIEYLKSKGYEFKRLDEIDYYSTGAEEDENSMIL